MKTNNIIKIQVANYEGVTVEIDTAKVSKETQDYFTKELQTERFKIWETLSRQSYFVGGVQVVTAPLDNIGYRAAADGDNFIFVNSKLPKAERTKIIRHFIQQRKQNASQ
jgi:hypothetical protein